MLAATHPRRVASTRAATACFLGSIALATLNGCKESSESGGAAGANQNTPFPEEREVAANTFTSARVCGACHQAIHACWQQSLHARAFSNGVFQAAYRTAAQTRPEAQTRLCLLCHAPVVRLAQAAAGASALQEEGVTCDFCHSVRDVKTYPAEVKVDLDVGHTKYGPLRHAQSPAHQVVESDLHRRSEFCASCHEYQNEYGVAVLETYSEWKAGAYAAAGKQCQDCHMPLVSDHVSALGLKRAGPPGVNLHDISGSHNLETVRKAVTVSITGADRRPDDSLRVRVLVSNVGSGHCFPTGMPLHRAILDLTVTKGQRQLGHQTLTFEKRLLDQNGKLITREYEAFLDARRVELDTRLKPKEARAVELTFADVDATDSHLEASLWYEYSTQCVVSRNGAETIEPVDMKFLVASHKYRVPAPGE